uniref:AraC family transcriptional regulator n=1 Tax=Acetatifactor sp. TaxID=1872090 RepID=UPI004055A459
MNTSLFHGNLVNSNRIIYTPSSFAKDSLLHLQETGQLQAQKPHTSRRENLLSYLFFLVLDGSGTLHYDGQTYSLQKGDCVFLDCRKLYSHSSSENLWTLRWVHFYGPSMHNIYEKYLQRGGIPAFRSENPDIYNELLQELFTVASSDSYVKDMEINAKLSALLTILMKESWHPDQNTTHASGKRNLREIKDYIDLHYTDKITLDHLAQEFFINKFYLTRLFKEQYGISLNHYLLQVRTTRAKQLLRFTDLSIEQVSQQCGMNDANYFSRMFKKIEGITPGEYRKRW